jgi:hypothetical protein
MKNRLTITLFLLPLLALTFSSCTGYEDGPAVSFTSPNKKMAGTWSFKEVIKNAVEITPQYTDDFVTFEEDGGFSSLDAERVVSLPPFNSPDTLPVLGRGSWDFLDKNNRIELFYTYNYQDNFDPDLFYQEEMYEQWTILRLTEEEFWLENDSMRYKLVPAAQ